MERASSNPDHDTEIPSKSTASQQPTTSNIFGKLDTTQKTENSTTDRYREKHVHHCVDHPQSGWVPGRTSEQGFLASVLCATIRVRLVRSSLSSVFHCAIDGKMRQVWATAIAQSRILAPVTDREPSGLFYRTFVGKHIVCPIAASQVSLWLIVDQIEPCVRPQKKVWRANTLNDYM